ncbi:hypothetical protein DXV75_10995 [Alteromonas aestuariivivens]|uniref:PEP-CTERM sorting domain-containing protein n=1 Tax=Alteromonas aestuariivivens TaxID=1938339 RepID=A0A3D8M636_9ALTE|nr:hypothetical protein [Alteromonas aestuariivivens]RDV25139.1 hypothetical protein DXV75_10995 [Alteromonas aestuariivivens]
MKRMIFPLILVVGYFVGTPASAAVIKNYGLDFQGAELTAYDYNNQNQGTYSVWDHQGSVLSLSENAWFTLNLSQYWGLDSINLDDPLTQWLISFDFFVKDRNDSGLSPEIAGLMFADFSQGVTEPQENRTFNLYGTQKFGYDNFSWDGSGWWVSYSFTLDEFMSGLVTDLVFINDCDGNVASDNCGGTNARFKDVVLKQVTEPTPVLFSLIALAAIGWRRARYRIFG